MSWDDAPLPYQSLDGSGFVLDVNAPWCEWSGYTAEEAFGHAYIDFVPEDHYDDFHDTFRHFTEQGYLRGRDCFFKRKDGSVRNVLIYGTMRSAPNGIVSHCMLVDVTGHRVTERLLAESEERFRALFALAPNPIVVHDGKEIVLANEAASSFLGYEAAEEVVGVPVADLVAPESAPEVVSRVKRMMSEDWVAPLMVERFVRKDGSTVQGETIASPIVLGGKRLVQVAALDMTARLRAETRLKESEERYRRLFDAAADGIVVHDGERVILANDSMQRQLAFPPEREVAGLKIMEFIHPDSRRAVGERGRELMEGADKTSPLEVRLLRTDGSVWEAEVKSTALFLNGRRVIQTTFRDLAERKRSERELARYRSELERLVDERTRSLHRVEAELESITAVIARTVELRDPYTAGHQRRVAELSVAVATEMGMSDEDVAIIRTAASIHDIGKVSVPAEILSKPGRFSPIEYELVKTHALSGYEIIASAELGRPVAEIVCQHHERLDGSGYPKGTKGEGLLPGSRVLMVADVVEAMSSHRPYRPAIGVVPALDEIRSGRGLLYDADVVDACIAVFEQGFEFSEPD